VRRPASLEVGVQRCGDVVAQVDQAIGARQLALVLDGMDVVLGR
jgi:hypothetical protein